MIITSGYADIPTDAAPMRTFLAAPAAEGEYPGIWCYSDIFQLSGPMLRACARLAGYGFVVAAPEIYHRIEPAGLVIPFDDAGRDRGMSDAAKTPVADFDADCRIGLNWLGSWALWDSASADIWPFAPRCNRMSAPRCVSTARGSTTASWVKIPMPVHCCGPVRFAANCS